MHIPRGTVRFYIYHVEYQMYRFAVGSLKITGAKIPYF